MACAFARYLEQFRRSIHNDSYVARESTRDAAATGLAAQREQDGKGGDGHPQRRRQRLQARWAGTHQARGVRGKAGVTFDNVFISFN